MNPSLPSIADAFAKAGVTGTVIVSALSGAREFVHNETRASTRFACASTFKILNTLIALEEGAIRGKDDMIPWDGRVDPRFPAWSSDQTLASAFRVSCVWFYQTLAARVGADAYRRYIPACGFGELAEPFDTTTFWLEGRLTISAREQIEFLRRLYRRQLPFSDASYDCLREVMLARTGPGYRQYGKTGWAARVTPQVGWYVGYVETDADVSLFAMNLEVRSDADLVLREQLALASLRAVGVLPDA